MSQESLIPFVFGFFALLSLGGALGVAMARTIFVSALWLVLSFVGVAGLYLLLGAGFLAVIQVLVYVGAISVLILFAIMLTEDVMGDEQPNNNQVGLALIVLTPIIFGLGRITDHHNQCPWISAAEHQIHRSFLDPQAVKGLKRRL